MRPILIFLLLTACMTYDPYTDEQKVSDSTKGAIIGGVAGAVLGNQVKGSRHVRSSLTPQARQLKENQEAGKSLITASI